MSKLLSRASKQELLPVRMVSKQFVTYFDARPSCKGKVHESSFMDRWILMT